LRRGQHQRVAQLYDLTNAVGIDNLDAGQVKAIGFDPHLARVADHVIDPFERDFDQVILRIVGDAEQRQPLNLDLVAEIERGDLDFGLLPGENLGYAVEIGAPYRLFQFLGHGRFSGSLVLLL